MRRRLLSSAASASKKNMTFNDQCEILRKCLGDFHSVEIKRPRAKVIVSDPVFFHMADHKQQELVMAKLPDDIKDEISLETRPTYAKESGSRSSAAEKPKSYDYDYVFKKLKKVPVNRYGFFVNYYLPHNIKDKFVLENKPLLLSDDKSIHRLELKKNVVIDFDLPATPQSILDIGVYYIEQKQNVHLATYCAWMCGNLQFNWFLLSHGIDADCSLLKKNVMSFLSNFEDDDETSMNKINIRWMLVEFAFKNSEDEDFYGFESIFDDTLHSAEIFSNLIYDIDQKKVFKRDEFIKWVLKSERRYEDMMKLKILHDGVWKEFKDVYSIDDVEDDPRIFRVEK